MHVLVHAGWLQHVGAQHGNNRSSSSTAGRAAGRRVCRHQPAVLQSGGGLPGRRAIDLRPGRAGVVVRRRQGRRTPPPEWPLPGARRNLLGERQSGIMLPTTCTQLCFRCVRLSSWRPLLCHVIRGPLPLNCHLHRPARSPCAAHAAHKIACSCCGPLPRSSSFQPSWRCCQAPATASPSSCRGCPTRTSTPCRGPPLPLRLWASC